MSPKRVAPVKKAKPKTRVSEFIESKMPYIHKGQQVQPRNVSKIPSILDELKLSEADKKLGAGSKSSGKKQLIKDLDEHIRDVHDPLQGVYRNEAMSDQSLGLNARANELANDIGIHKFPTPVSRKPSATEIQRLPQPSLRATAPPKGINKEDELMNFLFCSHQEKEKEKVKKKDNIYYNQGPDNILDAF
ncbi:MAG: hypothetical protein EZS28_000670 [Streblomastix strix]|uniref:Uncharacterized protein n=1 Tax=Streblomastix strix TaxID=222440 RepID=A0A5J4XBA8_9EUKA|nr:MAG: hypothetical protein EZS28_000670 [Streblomastix strix]